MLHTAIHHEKMYDLADELGVEHTTALGIMMCLLDWTYQNHRNGAIGLKKDRTIARACCWPLNDASSLIDGLVAAGWVDRNETFRLVIHDIFDHASDSWRKRMARDGELFWDGSPPMAAAGKAFRSARDKPQENGTLERDRSTTGQCPVNDRPTSPHLTSPHHTIITPHITPGDGESQIVDNFDELDSSEVQLQQGENKKQKGSVSEVNSTKLDPSVLRNQSYGLQANGQAIPFRDISRSDLECNQWLQRFIDWAVGEGLIPPGERMELHCFTIAEHCLRKAQNPGGMFRQHIAKLKTNELRSYPSTEDEDKARARMKDFDQLVQSPEENLISRINRKKRQIIAQEVAS